MSNSPSRISTAVAALLLMAALIPACSEDECPSCPDGTGGASVIIEVMHPDPEPFLYEDVWAAGPNDVFIAASNGVVMRYRNSSWIRYDTGIAMSLYGIWGASADNVYAVGDMGQIVHFDGSNWNSMYSGILTTLNAVWGFADTVFAAGDFASVLRYDGTRWSPVNIGLAPGSRYFKDVWGSSPEDIWFVGADWSMTNHGLLCRVQGPSTQIYYIPEVAYAVWGWSAGTVWAGDEGGNIWQWDGRGSWTQQPTGPGGQVWSIWGSAPNDVWAGTSVYGIYGYEGHLSHYDGSEWRDDPGPVLDWGTQSVFGVDANEVYAIGRGGELAGRDGGSWNTLNNERITSEDLPVIWGSAPDHLWTFGRRGQIYHHDGSAWSDTTLGGVTSRINGAWGSGPNDVYAVGDGGTVLHFNSRSWDVVNHGLPAAALVSVWGTGPNDVWVGGHFGQMMYYDGFGWELRDTWDPNYGPARALWGSAPNDYYAVVNYGVMQYDGSSWSVVQLDGKSVTDVHGLSSTEIYFLVAGGGIPSAESKESGAKRIARVPTATSLIRYDGTDYVVVVSGINAGLSRVWALGSNNIFFSGEQFWQPVIAHYNGSGVTVQTANVYANCYDLWCTGNTAYTSGYLGTVLRATTQ